MEFAIISILLFIIVIWVLNWNVPKVNPNWDFFTRIEYGTAWRDGWDAWCVDGIKQGGCWQQYAAYRSVVPALIHLLWCSFRYKGIYFELHRVHQWLE
jgi:hypothetical protein